MSDLVPLVAEVLDVELNLQLVADLVEQRAIQAGEAFEGDSVVGRGVDAAAIDRAQPHAPLRAEVVAVPQRCTVPRQLRQRGAFACGRGLDRKSTRLNSSH